MRDPQVLERFVRDRITEKTETDKIDFKLTLNFKTQEERLKLVALINALANTADAEYGDHGLLIYGLSREDGRVTQEVVLLTELGTDKLESQILIAVREHMSPCPRFNLFAFDEPGVGTWGVIVVWPNQTAPFVFTKPGTYSQGPNQSKTLWKKGEWRVRRGGAAAEPETDDYVRVFQERTAPLQRSLVVLETNLIEQRRQLDALLFAQDPARATNAQVIQAAFQTPARTLVRAVKSEVSQYLQAHQKLKLTGVEIPFRRLDRPQEAALLHQEDLRGLRDGFEQLERVTRPLVELLGLIAHEADVQGGDRSMAEAIDVSVTELANAVLFTGPNAQTGQFNGPSYAALEAYPAILLLFASAVTAASSSDARRWQVFGRMLHHQRTVTMVNRRGQQHLASHWSLRPQLDFLWSLFDRQFFFSPISEHMRELMERPDWLGPVLPTTDRHRVTGRGDLLTSLGYLVAELKVVQVPPFVPSAWMSFVEAPLDFRITLETIQTEHLHVLTGGRLELWQEALEVLAGQVAVANGIIGFGPWEIWNEVERQRR